MKLIRTLVVDDEPPGRQAIKDLLQKNIRFQIIGEAVDGADAVVAIRTLKPDLVFLDIQMPGLDGFGVIEQIGVENMPSVIFVTAYNFHALNAFDVHAIDYVLKPINPTRFDKAIERAIQWIGEPSRSNLHEALQLAAQKYPKRLVLRSSGNLEVISTDTIRYIEAQGDYVEFHTRNGKIMMRERLGNLEKRLDPAMFVRIHRGIILRFDLIKELHPTFNGDYQILLDDKTKLSLSRTYAEKVIALLSMPL